MLEQMPSGCHLCCFTHTASPTLIEATLLRIHCPSCHVLRHTVLRYQWQVIVQYMLYMCLNRFCEFTHYFNCVPAGGIGVGIAVAVFDFMLTTASVSSVNRVSRRSLAVWRPKERTFIDNTVYNSRCPQIVTLEVKGSVFFGSSIQVLSNMLEATQIEVSVEEKAEITRINSPLPHRPNAASRMDNVRLPESMSPISVSPGGRRRRQNKERIVQPKKKLLTSPTFTKPRFLVLDLSSVSTVDASAARGCFLQLAKMCAKREIVVCAAGANSRIDWLMRTHDTAQHVDLDILANGSTDPSEKILLFDALDEGEGVQLT